MHRSTRYAWLSAALTLTLAAGCGSKSSGWAPGQPLTIEVAGHFPAGAVVRDAYSGRTATVAAGGTVTVETAPDTTVVLLERDGAAPGPFSWQNATVYFAITDRFANGSTANDGSFGRSRDLLRPGEDVGTWHGGDFAGLTARLPYLAELGVTALWISPIVQQVRGWVGGGNNGEFRHYAYHGYWALDFTRLDPNFGTEAELQALVDGAHALGIRVVVDVVMNHPGYATGDDLLAYLPEVFAPGGAAAFATFQPTPAKGYYAWNDLVNYQSSQWTNWWTPPWVRASFPGFPGPNPADPLTMSLASLPDFGTEATLAAGLPVLLQRKGAVDGTGAVELPGAPVRQYLVAWHTDWVRRFGIDGFRCDTAKHVELAAWKALKDGAAVALADWKAAHPEKALDAAPFWMTGEVFPHGPTKDAYYTAGGFDSLLNFDFQGAVGGYLGLKPSLVAAAAELDALYAAYAAGVSADPGFNPLSYVSSHDTQLFFAGLRQDAARQRQAGTALLLAPGAVQIFYGDESGRTLGPSGGDSTQATRSDMNWDALDATIHDHWQKLATFRKRHVAIGAGTHQRLAAPAGSYAFGRRRGDDAVVVALVGAP